MSDTEIWEIVEAWVDDLACDDFESAFMRTGHSARNRWTPSLIRAVINGYGLPEPHPTGVAFDVTDRATATGRAPDREIERYEVADTEIAGEVWVSLPLNGEWSDLTATFLIVREGSRERLLLDEIHVF